VSSVPAEFPCGDITLEGEWHLPQVEDRFPAVIVCHPHSLYGGNMHNNIVMAICDELSRQSIAAFRFNFRGVGRSGGSFGGGVAEREDVKAAITFVSSTSNIDSTRIGLAGYSFGGSVALPVAVEDRRVGLLALVSPAILETGWEQLEQYNRPKFVIAGDADTVIMLERMRQNIKDVHISQQFELVPGADHFWWGYEEQLARKVTGFFTDNFEC